MLRIGQHVLAAGLVHPAGHGRDRGAGINNAGDIVGDFIRHGHRFGFLLRDGVYTTVNVPGSIDTYAGGINAAGVIVGGYTDAAGDRHGYLVSRGGFRTLDVPNGTAVTRPHAINAAGDVVGGYSNRSGIHGFLLHDGTYTTIDVL